MPSSVHCIPLADWPGALNRISIEPAGRVLYPGVGAAGVFAWPASAVHGRAPTSMAPPAVAAAACNHSLRLIVVMAIPFRVIAKVMLDEPTDQQRSRAQLRSFGAT